MIQMRCTGDFYLDNKKIYLVFRMHEKLNSLLNFRGTLRLEVVFFQTEFFKTPC